MAGSGYGKATEKEISHVLDLIGRGEPIPGGFAYNGSYDPPVWRVPDHVTSEHMSPPGAKDAAPDTLQVAPDETGRVAGNRGA